MKKSLEKKSVRELAEEQLVLMRAEIEQLKRMALRKKSQNHRLKALEQDYFLTLTEVAAL